MPWRSTSYPPKNAEAVERVQEFAPAIRTCPAQSLLTVHITGNVVTVAARPVAHDPAPLSSLVAVLVFMRALLKLIALETAHDARMRRFVARTTRQNYRTHFVDLSRSWTELSLKGGRNRP